MLDSASVREAIAFNLGQQYSRTQVQRVQTTIGTPADGKWGPATIEALRRWQSLHGFEPNGRAPYEPESPAWNALGLTPDSPSPSSKQADPRNVRAKVATQSRPSVRAQNSHAPANIAEFDSDQNHEVDQLDVQRHVRAMAAIIASREIDPPLSIGLFGPWGTGKTFFMQSLARSIGECSQAARAAVARDVTAQPPYHVDIAHITFNAWQYADANLWASMVSHVFGSLAEHFGHGEREAEHAARESVLAHSKLGREGLSRARVELERADLATKRARTELDGIRRQREQIESSSPVDTRLDDDPRVTAIAKELRDRYGFGAIDDLWALQAEAQTLVQRMSDPTRRLQEGFGHGRIAGWGLLGLGLVLAGAAWVALERPGFDHLEKLMLAATPLLATVGERMRRASRHLGELRAALGSANQTINRVREESEAAANARQTRLEALSREEADALERLADRELERELARRRVDDVRSTADLAQFITDRTRSDDYRQQLGMIAQIREDFERLERLVVEGQKLDRIVLYIDDLDRCPGRRVVEVIQAVHLLLASPLFVVIVAVDPRWLSRALLESQDVLLAADEDHEGASARNYLEKIFQIPFRVGRLQPEHFSDYVNWLTRNRPTRPRAPSPSRTEPDERLAAPQPAPARSATGSDRSAHQDALLAAERMQLSRMERDELAAMGRWFSTPRATKRFVNCYRLIRATLNADQRDALLEGGGHRSVIALLAVAIGDPRRGHELFDFLRNSELSEFPASLTETDPVGFAALASAGLDELRRWRPAVERYAFYL